MNMTPKLKETQELLNNINQKLKEISDSMTQTYLQKTKDEILFCVEQLQTASDQIEHAINFTYFGQKSGGQRKTVKKAEAVRENGKKGGRPSSKVVSDISKTEDGNYYIVTFNDKTKRKILGKTINAVREAFPPTRYKWTDTMEYMYQKLTQK